MTINFSGVLEQVDRLLTINEQVWKDPQISREAVYATRDPVLRSIQECCFCITLVYETGDVHRTLQRNLDACRFIHRDSEVYWDGRIDERTTGPSLIHSAHPRAPGLRWIKSELGSLYRGQSMQKARDRIASCAYGQQQTGIGAELPMIAAMHPEWAKAIDGNTIPWLYASDLEFESIQDWEDNYTIMLNAFWKDRRILTGYTLLFHARYATHPDDPSAGCGYIEP